MSGTQVQKINSVGVESASSISSCEIGPVALWPEAPDANPEIAKMPQPRAAAALGAVLLMDPSPVLDAATRTDGHFSIAVRHDHGAREIVVPAPSAAPESRSVSAAGTVTVASLSDQ